MRDALASVDLGAGAVERGHGFRCKFLFLDRSHRQGAGKRFNQDFEKIMHGGEFFLRQHVDQQVGLLALLYEIEFHLLPLAGWHPTLMIPPFRLPVRLVAVNHEIGVSASAQFVQVHADALAVRVHAEWSHAIQKPEQKIDQGKKYSEQSGDAYQLG